MSVDVDFKSVSIALVEDNACDADFFERILKKLEFDGTLERFTSGEELLNRVSGAQGGDPWVPSFIFLDISLPGTDGKEVLRQLKSNNKTCLIPVIMLSGSNSQRDLAESISHGCNGYLVKSADRQVFTQMCSNFITGWAMAVRQRFV